MPQQQESAKKQVATSLDNSVSLDEPGSVAVTTGNIVHHEDEVVVPPDLTNAVFGLLGNTATQTMFFDPNPEVWRPIAETLWELLGENGNDAVAQFVGAQPCSFRWPELILWTCVAESPDRQIKRYAKQHVDAIHRNPNSMLP